MNIYILRPLDFSHPTFPRYDSAHGFVVRAEDETQARKLAATESGDEGPDFWMRKNLTSCKELASNVEEAAGVLLRDFNAG